MNFKRYLIYAIMLAVLGCIFYIIFNSKEKSYISKDNSAPAYIKKGENDSLPQIFLTDRSIDNLDLQTVVIIKDKKTIPFSAILYDINGKTWVYTNPEPRIFIRKQVTIDTFFDSQVILSDPLLSNTKVVTIGALELFAVESGIGQGKGY